jgi:hypothetical protein
LRRAERFQVLLERRSQPVIDVQRNVLEANWLVWKQARSTIEAMPQSAFLPANTWTRLAVEPPADAVQAAAWLAVNDAVDACDESEALDNGAGSPTDVEAIRRRAARLAVRLDIVVSAIAATLTILPQGENAPLETVLAVAEPAARWAGATASGMIRGPLPIYIDRLHVLHATWPAAPVLPTLDPTPLDRMP